MDVLELLLRTLPGALLGGVLLTIGMWVRITWIIWRQASRGELGLSFFGFWIMAASRLLSTVYLRIFGLATIVSAMAIILFKASMN